MNTSILMKLNFLFCYSAIRSLTRLGIYLFFSYISPNPSLGYIIPPTPGNTLPCASLDVSIANVRNSNLLLIDSGNSAQSETLGDCVKILIFAS